MYTMYQTLFYFFENSETNSKLCFQGAFVLMEEINIYPNSSIYSLVNNADKDNQSEIGEDNPHTKTKRH